MKTFYLCILLWTSGCLLVSGQTVRVFDNERICFDPNLYQKNYIYTDSNKIIHLTNGRIILKKIALPFHEQNLQMKLTAHITLSSDGDPWDKTGSCFIIPHNSEIHMINIAKGEKQYPLVDSMKYENLKGIVASEKYQPVIELMRFMTPFGVGYYSKNDSSESKQKPVYIDRWAENVEWSEDITHLYSIFKDSVYVGIYIDTWTKEGFLVNLDIDIEVFGKKTKEISVNPIINTVYYMGQSYPDIFCRKDLEASFHIPPKAKNVRIKYIATGHGGHSGGDEFKPTEHSIYVDNSEVFRFIPWRNDCASFRRYNPSAGVWLVKRMASYIGEKGYEEKEIEESLASSDLSRSNWCPGSLVSPIEIPLNMDSGTHIIRFSIPQALASHGEKLNHWLISAYIVWEE